MTQYGWIIGKICINVAYNLESFCSLKIYGAATFARLPVINNNFDLERFSSTSNAKIKTFYSGRNSFCRVISGKNLIYTHKGWVYITGGICKQLKKK